jgi:hypothetical protein
MKSPATNGPAAARPPGGIRFALIGAGVLALLASLVVTAPAQAGDYEDSYYGSQPGYGYAPYRYAPYRRYHGCSSCGCWQRCSSISRPGLVYERRYIEREYVERRYGWPTHHYRRHYSYNPYGGYRSWSRPFPWGYGGVRRWRAPYSYRYEPSADRDAEPPRSPAPVWDGARHQAVPYDDESAHWNAGRSWPRHSTVQAPVAAVGAVASQLLSHGPAGMIASGLLGSLNLGTR